MHITQVTDKDTTFTLSIRILTPQVADVHRINGIVGSLVLIVRHKPFVAILSCRHIVRSLHLYVIANKLNITCNIVARLIHFVVRYTNDIWYVSLNTLSCLPATLRQLIEPEGTSATALLPYAIGH